MKKYWRILLIIFIIEIAVFIYLILFPKYFVKEEFVEIIPEVIVSETIPPAKNTVTDVIKKVEIIPTIRPTRTVTIAKIKDNTPWGVSQQIDEHTWTIRVGEDEKLATSEEILKALNEYRQIHGSQILSSDIKLTNYAKERAVYLNKIKTVDQHKGFSDYLENQDGFNKLGFTALGENISYGYKLNGVHVIEWMYAGDKPHDDNQLDSKWNYVGIGVDGLATCLIFGTGRM